MYKILSSDGGAISAFCSVITISEDNRPNEYCHNNYELIYFICGSGKYVVEGKEYSVCGNSVLAIRPLAYHCVMLNEGEELEFVSIRFNENAITGTILEMLKKILPDEEHSGFYPRSSFADAVISAFDRIELAQSLPDECKAEYLKAITAEIIILLSVHAKEGQFVPEQELGARVIRYLNANIEKNVSLDKLARRFFVSKYYLCRAFKKYSGTSVHSYINYKRIMYAKQLIDMGETASGAAFKVGFGDYSAFYRAYVKILGKSPSAE